MIHFTLTHHANDAAQQLAQAVAHDLTQTLLKKERATLAVSGGRSPIAFFQALSQCELAWSRINITLVDERIVPTHHADSNTALVRKHLLCNHAAAARYLPIIDDEADENQLQNTNQVLDFALKHYIQPDVLVLGMGNDGHTASLFPQAPQLNDALDVCYPRPLLHTSPMTAPHERISMTLAAIEATPHRYLAISGMEKHTVYQQAKTNISSLFPISYILNSTKGNIHVFYHD